MNSSENFPVTTKQYGCNSTGFISNYYYIMECDKTGRPSNGCKQYDTQHRIAWMTKESGEI